MPSPLFRVAFDTNAVIQSLRSLATLETKGRAYYPYVALSLKLGYLKVHVLKPVYEELINLTQFHPRSRLRRFYEQLHREGIIIEHRDYIRCCQYESLRECYETRVRPYIWRNDVDDERILREFFSLVDFTLSTHFNNPNAVPLNDIVLHFITENRQDYDMNVASSTTACILHLLNELDLSGAYTPEGGIYDLRWLNERIEERIQSIASRI